MEARLLAGLTDLFEELAGEDRRRRTSWEERSERSLRELRATVDADMARGACESRRLLAEAKREAAEARKMAQPCADLIEALERQELPQSFLAGFRREAQAAVSAEMENMLPTLRAQISDAVVATSRDHAEQLSKALESEGGRWADVCTRQVTEGMLREQQSLESRVSGALDCVAKDVERRSAIGRQELCDVVGELEQRLAARLFDLQEAHTTLQAILDRYAGRWEKAWCEEADARAQADKEAGTRLEQVAHANEVQTRALEASLFRISADAQQRAQADAAYTTTPISRDVTCCGAGGAGVLSPPPSIALTPPPSVGGAGVLSPPASIDHATLDALTSAASEILMRSVANANASGGVACTSAGANGLLEPRLLAANAAANVPVSLPPSLTSLGQSSSSVHSPGSATFGGSGDEDTETAGREIEHAPSIFPVSARGFSVPPVSSSALMKGPCDRDSLLNISMPVGPSE
jgi:hypothetical protein